MSVYSQLAHERIEIATMLAVSQREILDLPHGNLSDAILGLLIAVVRIRNVAGADTALDGLLDKINERKLGVR
jgi:hypothetical protein